MIGKYLIFLTILMAFSFSVHAQEGCGDRFENVSLSCIQKYESKMGEGKYELKKIKVDDVFFYRTSRGSFGKFRVESAFVSKESCLFYIDPETYVDRKVEVPSNRLMEIKQSFNSWGRANSNLDSDNDIKFDISLSNEGGKCIVSTVDGEFVKFKNMNPDNKEEFPILFVASLVLIFISVYIIASAVFAEEEKFKASDTLEEGTESEVPVNQDFVLKYSRPFFKRYFSPAVKSMKGKRKIRDKYRRKLANAGLSKELSPEDFYAFKLFLIIGFPIAYLGLRYLLETDWPLALTPVMGLVGYVYPDIWINGVMDRRKAEIIMGMPFIVDMLALSVEAGLDFVAAMHKVIEKAPPSPLVHEFEQMIKEIKIGASRAEGLRQLAWRTDVLQVSSFTATLIAAADSVGASIGPILKTLSAEIRQKRSSDAEKKGAQAATKILFPMMIFIMPSVMLIIFAPMILQFLAG